MLKTVFTIRVLILLSAGCLSLQASAHNILFTINGSNPRCAGSTAVLNYDNGDASFSGNNILTAVLSDANGSFANPTIIGTLTTSAGVGQISVTFPATASGTNYRIRLVSTNEPVIGEPGPAITIVHPATPTVSIVSASGTTLCDNTTGSFNATATNGGTNPIYRWFHNDVEVPGNVTSNLSIALADGDRIRCTMTSNSPCVTTAIAQSNVITMVVRNTVTAAIQISGPPTICPGVGVQFVASQQNGGTTPSYQWKKNNVNVGTNSASYTDNALTNGDVLVCVLTSNRECLSSPTANSNTINIAISPTITPSIKITADPPGAVGPGSFVYFSSEITGGGPGPAYEWKKNGVVISESNSFTLGNLTNGDEITAKVFSNAPCAFPTSASSNTIGITIDTELTKSGHAWESRASQTDGAQNTIVRSNATGFSIGSKGYIGVGFSPGGANIVYRKDLWEYDPAADTWMQKADLPGVGRYNAVGFSIGTKGYIGLGLSATGVKKDFWQYDPLTNTWLQRLDFPGAAREQAFYFSAGSKGYVGGGFSNGQGDFKDFFEFDPAANTWTPRPEFPAGKRMGSASFSIDTKGFVAGGFSFSSNEWFKDLWEYDQSVHRWIRRADMPANPRTRATGFALASNGYVGLGFSSNGYEGQFFQYTQSTDSWSWKPYYPGPAQPTTAMAVAIGNRAFVYKDGTWTEYSMFNVEAFSSKLCSTEAVSVNWNTSGFAFGANNTVTAQISQQPNFSVATTLGFATSSSPTGTVNAFIPASVESGTYYFRLISSSPVMSTLLESITVTALPPTHAITSETGASICKDIPAVFKSNLTGSGFQWFRNSKPVGTDAESFTTADLTTGDVIKSVRYYDQGCREQVGLSSNTIIMTVREPSKPTISVIPNTLLSSPAVAYQWYSNGAQIASANRQSYIMTKAGAYKVRTTDSGGCFAFSDELTGAFVGLEDEIADGSISFFPNPVLDDMRLDVSNDLVSKGCSFSVFNELGQTVVPSRQAEASNKISFSGRASGLYLIRLSVGGATIVRKVVKVD